MIEPEIRKTQLTLDRTYSAGGKPLPDVHFSGSIAAVVSNPFAGTFASEADVSDWMKALQPLASEMAIELRDALIGDDRSIETCGKGATVGGNGELEMAAAWHAPAGVGLRSALDGPLAQVPSSKKIGAIGSQLDIPLVYLHASYLRSHYDVQPVVVPDGPKPDEVVYALVMSSGPRPHHRIGGFSIDEVVGKDGLR